MKHIKRPEYKDLEKRIIEIESMILSSVTIDEIKEKLNLLFTGYTICIPLLRIGSILFRGIKINDKPELFSFLKYPQPEIANIGRANRQGISMFYRATDKVVPFYELDVKAGDKLVVSEWTVVRDMLVNNVGYTNSAFSKMASNRELPSYAKEKVGKPEEIGSNKLVGNFLAETFCQKISENEHEKYLLTNAISEKHFSENPQEGVVHIQGLMYPTIKMNANADNISLEKQTIDDNYLKFEKVEYIEILQVEQEKFTYKIIDIAFNVTEENIIWENMDFHWIGDTSIDLVIIKQDNILQAYNYEGDIIEPTINKA